MRLRRADEPRRYVASQRAGRVDPNPHQIDAVVFALRRIPEGGCILADEVGLGKTIEAGLVIAQMLSEGARRILLITPKPLMGQWRQELYRLFDLHVKEGKAERGAFDGDGVFIVGREAAGSATIAGLLERSAAFDLCVVDEAHEVFAAIHKRYADDGSYKEDARHAKLAHRVREVLHVTPVLLLTATPIQNSLLELWGLVQYVDPSGTLLGDLPTFREVFTEDAKGRRLALGSDHELRRRLARVVQRTLRRQAQEFMERPFVGRRAQTFDYRMSEEEKRVYDDVTRYLLRPDIQAFRGPYRSLLLLGFHRRMASSKAALAKSLTNVESRLRRMLRAAEAGRFDEGEETAAVFADDLDGEDEIVEALRAEATDEGELDAAAVRLELQHVTALRESAEQLSVDSKAQACIQAVRAVLQRGHAGEGAGKLVIFTESLTTQEYVRDLLIESALVTPEEITLFRGDNRGERATEALSRWEAEVERDAEQRPSRDVAVRLALVHEFRTRSRVFISTEAGAKGLNLQFCDTIVNYDLPWNPQRIEQRIGRCHRYGQARDVTVINFLATDNEAQRLTYEILSEKLALFGHVLGASDVVLHADERGGPDDAVLSAISTDFEKQLGAIYRRARSVEEITAELRKLRDATEARRVSFEAEHARTAQLIQSRLDASVREHFAAIAEGTPEELAELDRDLEQVVLGFLDAAAVPHVREEKDGAVRYRLGAHPALPRGLREGGAVWVGEPPGGGPAERAATLHLAHPLLLAALDEARHATGRPLQVVFGQAEGRGWLRVVKVRRDGLEPVEHVLAVAARASGEGSMEPVSPGEVQRWLDGELGAARAEAPAPPEAAREALDDALEEAMFLSEAEHEEHEQRHFEERLERLERFVEDRLLVLEKRRARIEEQRVDAERRRDAAVAPSARKRALEALSRLATREEELDEEIERLRGREDERYQREKEALHARRYAPPTVETLLVAAWEGNRSVPPSASEERDVR